MRFIDRFLPGPPASVVREFVDERNALPEVHVDLAGGELKPSRRLARDGFRGYTVPNDPRRGPGRRLFLTPAPRPRGPACDCLTAEEHMSGCKRAGHA
jgi:hypothetical protein